MKNYNMNVWIFDIFFLIQHGIMGCQKGHVIKLIQSMVCYIDCTP